MLTNKREEMSGSFGAVLRTWHWTLAFMAFSVQGGGSYGPAMTQRRSHRYVNRYVGVWPQTSLFGVCGWQCETGQVSLPIPRQSPFNIIPPSFQI